MPMDAPQVAVATDPVPEVADSPPRRRTVAALTTLRALFAPAAARRVSRRGVLLATAAVLAGTVVSLLRTTGTGPLQSIWEEDARDILTDALWTSGAKAVLKPAVGYFVIGPRLLGELATVFPISWAAAVLSISSALITALFALAVYVASGSHFSSRLARFAVSAPLLTAPVAENWLSEVYNRPVCLHFFALYAVFWMLLWSPATRGGRAAAVAVVAFTAFSTIVAIAFIPLAALRVLVRRDRLGLVLLGLLVAGAALDFAALKLGLASRGSISAPRLDPVWALTYYAVWAVPNSVLGFRATSDLAYLPDHLGEVASRNAFVIGLSWFVVAAVVAGAVLAGRRGLVRPAWSLAALAGMHSVGLLSLMIMANGAIAQRYLPPVEMLLFVAVVALLRPAVPGERERAADDVASARAGGRPARRAAALLAAFVVFVAAISALNYRWTNTYRAHAPRWTAQIAQAAARCHADPGLSHVVVRGGPKPWWSTVVVPCHELRKEVACTPPQCQWLDPQSLGDLPGPSGSGPRDHLTHAPARTARLPAAATRLGRPDQC